MHCGRWGVGGEVVLAGGRTVGRLMAWWTAVASKAG